MKRSLPIALLTLLIAVLLATSNSSSAFASSSQTALAPIYEHNINARFIGDPFDKEGARIEFANPIYDATNETQIGASVGSCLYTSPVLLQCNWTLILPDGTISLAGAQHAQRHDAAYAVVGGTGIYSQIKGEAYITGAGYITNGEAVEYKYEFNLY